MKSRHKNKKDHIILDNVSVGYPGVTVLKNLSFTVPKGSVTAIIGPNGSGKSTLMKAILGLIPHSKGTILVENRDVTDSYGRLGYVPQKLEADRNFPITVGEFLALTLKHRNHSYKIAEKLGEVGLNPVTARKMQLSELSGGQLQRAMIARAIMNDPDILFLDEPATGIDISGEQSIFLLLEHLRSEHDTTIVIISHEISFVEKHVDHVICINQGLVCAGPPKHALTDKNIDSMFGEDHARIEHTH